MRNKSLSSLSKELMILHITKSEGELTQKDLEKNNLDFRDPIDLLNLGYLSVKGEKDYPYCSYYLTSEGEKYSEKISEFLNKYPHSKTTSEQ